MGFPHVGRPASVTDEVRAQGGQEEKSCKGPGDNAKS